MKGSQSHVETSDHILKPLGYEQNKTLTTAKGLTVPDGAQVAVIQCLTQHVRWRDDGNDPTAAIGMRLASEQSLFYTGDLTAIKFIQEAATAELNITYYE